MTVIAPGGPSWRHLSLPTKNSMSSRVKHTTLGHRIEGPQRKFGKFILRQPYSDFYVLGNPATVTRKLRQLIERLNPGYLLIYGNEGDMAHQDVMRPIELLGKEVIPALHTIKLHPYE